MIILVGPSASGKTEVAKLLSLKYGIKKVVTATTREKRFNEIEDVDYYFLSEDEFNNYLIDDAFVETTTYNNYHYGTFKKEIAKEKCLIVDPSGVDSFLKLNLKCIQVYFLSAGEKARFNRMMYRGDSTDAINKRLDNDRVHFASDKIKYDLLIDTESHTIDEVADIVYKHYHKHLNQCH